MAPTKPLGRSKTKLSLGKVRDLIMKCPKEHSYLKNKEQEVLRNSIPLSIRGDENKRKTNTS